MTYNVNGESISAIYDVDGTLLNNAYDIDGEQVFAEPDPYIPGRLLLFEDTFDSFNANNWIKSVGVNASTALYIYRSGNTFVKNSKLVFAARKESHLGHDWSSGGVQGIGQQSWMFGRFEAKMKLPGKIGSFPAFWCMGNSARTYDPDDDGNKEYIGQLEGGQYTQWPICGEIDITEGIPGNTQRPPCNIWGSDGNSLGNQNFTSNIDTTKWHVYAMEWTDSYIAMLIDNTEYKRWTFSSYDYDIIKAYVTEPMSIIINLAVGGSGGTPLSSEVAYDMYVDWVRVYAPVGVNEPIEATAISMPSTQRLKKGYRNYIAPKFTPYNTSRQHVTWSTSDDTTVAVDNKGWFFGVNYGTAIITAVTDNGVSAQCVVTVVDSL